jgi:iron complex transport system substrate-binding protein
VAQQERNTSKRSVLAQGLGFGGLIIAALVFLFLLYDSHLSFAYDDSMKRRQQGILTGMPFMSNIAPRTFVDNHGRKLYLATPPKRIVSLAPSVTELLFALGLDDEIVGVTEFCNFPPQAKTKPKVGYSSPNLESIVRLEPDLVLAPRAFLRADLLSKFEELKIPTFILEAKLIEDIYSQILTLGRMLGKTPEAITLSTAMRKRVGTLTALVENLPRRSVLYILNTEPLITVGPGSYVHHLIELAGGRNIAEKAAMPYPRLDMEEVLRQNPDVLIFSGGKFGGIPDVEHTKWARWKSITAVQQGALFEIESDLINRPGPRVVEGVEALIRIIHPNVFPNSSPSR